MRRSHLRVTGLRWVPAFAGTTEEQLRPEAFERDLVGIGKHPPPLGTGSEAERTRRRLEALLPLRPFPAPEDLPVVVAARMSLSFPLR